jgi:hypothetical protein
VSGPEAPFRPRARTARDYYLELIQGSQRRPGFLAERDRWLRSLEVAGREELLFELEMLLRGLERSFNLHNLPIEKSRPVVGRDFSPELSDVRDAIDRAIRVARQLLDPEEDQRRVFRRYVESQLADDRARLALLEEQLQEDSPAGSLFLLRQSFEALRSIIDHLLRREPISFALFNDMGSLALREILLNPYFRPFRPLEFRIEYDRIKSAPLLEALSLRSGHERTVFSVAFLALFRLLHYLAYVGDGDRRVPPRARVILALVHSEAQSLSGYLREEMVARAPRKDHKRAAVRAARDLIRENRRVALELEKAGRGSAGAPARAAAAYSAVFRDQVVQLARALEVPLPDGPEPFAHLSSPVEMAQRVRRELWVFARLCREAEAALRKEEPARKAGALRSLRAFIAAFYDVGYQLLRYGDFEAFDRFAGMILELEQPPEGPAALDRLATDCRLFAQVLDATFAAVSRRAQLSRHAFDVREAESLLARFRPEVL